MSDDQTIQMDNMNRSPNRNSSPPGHPGHTGQPTPPPVQSSPVNNRRPMTLLRKLNSIDIFMIGICTVIGMGLYVRTGIILNTGGPGAVIYSFAFLGFLTWMVMHCLTTMLRVWPIAGAIVIFIEKFVDKEVAQVVALLYWLTFCFSFAGLTTVIIELGQYYDHDDNPETCRKFKAWSGVVCAFSLVVPLACNLLPVQCFRYVERVLGVIKLFIVLIIIITMNIINPTVSEVADIGPDTTYTARQSTSAKPITEASPSFLPSTDIFKQQDGWNGGWFAALVACILIASFAFIGIEAIAVTAKEVVFETNSDDLDAASLFSNTAEDLNPPPESTEDGTVTRDIAEGESLPVLDTDIGSSESTSNNPFELASLLPLVITVIYMWAGWIVTQNVSWKSVSLPSLEWTDNSDPCNADISIFVMSADKLHKKGVLANFLTGLLIINIASTSGAALYIASRALFGYTSAYARNHKDARGRRIWIARKLSITTSWGVPWVSVSASVWMFFLLFLMRLLGGDKVIPAIDVVSYMASVSCIITWGLISFAASRFYRCCRRHPNISVSGRFKSIMKVGLLFVLTTLLKWTRKPSESYAWPRIRLGVDLRDPTEVNRIFDDLDDQIKHKEEGRDEAQDE
ncbi:amino acid permease-domain-containing protein [Ilyonectria sp. MPI-CAGE-AT-0026]|nr:amino acid permease-domain-containing protein [Ilyonectria sp. MPI-CAGE-AT-0026]